MNWWVIGAGAVVCGVLGRCGGKGAPYKSWMRDWLCPLITLITLWFLDGFKLSYWWTYLLSYVLLGLSLTTYLDVLFGYDHLWLSGFLAGLAFLPFAWCGIAWWLIVVRACILAVVWGCLNRFLPQGYILLWRRDIVEENLRYGSLVATLPIIL